MATIDFTKSLKDLYTATKTIQEVRPGTGTFLAVDGQGEPGGTAFQDAIRDLYTVAYTLKFACKLGGGCDFKVNKLEGLYFSDPAATPKAQWQWRLLVRIPDEVSSKHVADARRAVREKKGLDVASVKRLRWKEGPALQVLHVGPYDQVGPTYAQLEAFAQAEGREVSCPAHEIYLSDPRMTPPERIKTIVRLAVKKRGAGKRN